MLAAALIATALSLGGGLGLLPGEPKPEPPDRPVGTRANPAPGPRPPGVPPASPLLVLALAGTAVLASSNRRGRDDDELSPGGALGLRPPPDMRVVLVPGHGDSHAPARFADMVRLLGVDPANVRYFDYRWITGLDDHRLASKLVGVEAASLSLNSYLAGVAAEGHPVYVVGFSKGGATMAHLVAEWDRGHPGPADSVVGTALLDPPIASGVTGWLQSLGRFWGSLPDDGGYEPYRCTIMRIACTDSRVDLGRPSGVEVLVIQNPKAGITNVGTPPPGLRVVDAPDDGPGMLEQLRRNPFALPGRISDAHESVLRDPSVAECIVNEMWSPGSCVLGALSGTTRPSGAVRAPLSMRVL